MDRGFGTGSACAVSDAASVVGDAIGDLVESTATTTTIDDGGGDDGGGGGSTISLLDRPMRRRIVSVQGALGIQSGIGTGTGRGGRAGATAWRDTIRGAYESLLGSEDLYGCAAVLLVTSLYILCFRAAWS